MAEDAARGDALQSDSLERDPEMYPLDIIQCAGRTKMIQPDDERPYPEIVIF